MGMATRAEEGPQQPHANAQGDRRPPRPFLQASSVPRGMLASVQT